MANEKKSSVIKEAITEWSEIQEAAVANAKKNLVEEYPEKFSDLLKEELNKNKSKKESYKKVDEAKESDKDDIESNKESVMKKEKETKKVVKEGEENQPFDDKAPEVGPDVVKEERDKDFMGAVESDTPNINTPLPEDGKVFTDKITTKQDTLANKTTMKEEFDITELDAKSVGTALEEAGDDDEVITMDEIEEEISAMNLAEDLSTGVDAEKPTTGKDDGIAFKHLVNMRKQLDEVIGGLGEQKKDGGKGANQVELGGPGTKKIEEEAFTPEEVEDVLGGGDEPTAELGENLEHTQTHHNARKTGSHNNVNYGKEDRLRDAQKNEGNIKIGSLISENKGLTKKLNETKKYKKSVTTLVEQYKSALDKYRNQLKEMATFNTNLAHVNNLLVNESLALTQEDKINIINDFKTVDTIAESQEKYKNLLSEMKTSKKTLTETVEGKVAASVAPSSKNLDEAKEVTVYKDDKHILRIKKIMESIDKRGSKKII
jgi:hypothetical protein